MFPQDKIKISPWRGGDFEKTKLIRLHASTLMELLCSTIKLN